MSPSPLLIQSWHPANRYLPRPGARVASCEAAVASTMCVCVCLGVIIVMHPLLQSIVDASDSMLNSICPMLQPQVPAAAAAAAAPQLLVCLFPLI